MYLVTLCFRFTDQPDITAQPQHITPTEEENVTLSCNAIGNPTPSISWTKDGSAVNSPRISLSLDNKQLTITHVNRSDSGQYRCVANNSIGAAVTSDAATLDVQCKYSGFLHPILRLLWTVLLSVPCAETLLPGWDCYRKVQWVDDGKLAIPLPCTN